MTDEWILDAVDSKRDAALAAHHFVHEHPELAHHEHECSRYLSDVLDQAGLDVDREIPACSPPSGPP
jgi:metal-dependent amidase/aminoacylase/carboxypeptidase family protein